MSHSKPETIGDRLRALKEQIRDTRGVKVTNAELAVAAGVDEKTPTFWQAKKPYKGKSKIQEPSDENLAGIVKLAASYEVETSVALLRYGQAAMIPTRPATPEELDKLEAKVRELAAEIDNSRAQHTPSPGEISRLQDLLSATINAGFEASQGNQPARLNFIRASVRRLTSRTEPARAVPKAVSKKQATNGKKRR